MSNTFKQTGVVKFFKRDKAYGFITMDENQEDLFVHKNDCNGVELQKGERVEFIIGDGKKGKIAQEVAIVD